MIRKIRFWLLLNNNNDCTVIDGLIDKSVSIGLGSPNGNKDITRLNLSGVQTELACPLRGRALKGDGIAKICDFLVIHPIHCLLWLQPVPLPGLFPER
jgi:hypothetical protein